MATRKLVTYMPLPDRATSAERIATLDADVREAAGVARTKIEHHAQRFTNTGWTLDDDSWEMVMLPGYKMIVTANVRRDD